jgi:hypothetical protein
MRVGATAVLRAGRKQKKHREPKGLSRLARPGPPGGRGLEWVGMVRGAHAGGGGEWHVIPAGYRVAQMPSQIPDPSYSMRSMH